MIILVTLLPLFFQRSRNSKLLRYRWYAALFVVLSGIRVCCIAWLIVYFMGGPLVFVWARHENFLVTRDRPVGNKVTNTICLS